MPGHCLRAYRSSRGRSDVLDWYESLRSTDKAKLEVELQYNLRQERPWKSRFYKELKGNGQGIAELRIKHKKTQIRLLGFFVDNVNFVVTIKCIEKSGKYDPPNAIETALRRKKEILQGSAASEDWFYG